MNRLTRNGTAEPVSRDQILRHARGQGNVHFPCSADHEQDWQPYPVDPYPYSAICDDHTYIHDRAGLRGYVQFNKYIHTYIHTVSLIPPWEDQCEWHRMTRMTGPDCAVMCNLINIHTYSYDRYLSSLCISGIYVQPAIILWQSIDQPSKVVNPSRDQRNMGTTMFVFPVPARDRENNLARQVRSSPTQSEYGVLFEGIPPAFHAGDHFYSFKPPYAIEPAPNLSFHAIAYRGRSLPPRVHPHGAISPQGSSSSNGCCLFKDCHGPTNVGLYFPTPAVGTVNMCAIKNKEGAVLYNSIGGTITAVQ